MRVWAIEPTPVKDFVFKTGWQDVPDDVWDKLTGNRTRNLRRDGKLKWTDGVTSATATPPRLGRIVVAKVELPTKAADVASLIRAVTSLAELDALGVEDDDRKPVRKAYDAKTEELDAG